MPELKMTGEQQPKPALLIAQTAALNGIVGLPGEIVADMAARNERIPEPLSKRTYSGNIALRTTPNVHRKLTISAAERGISLNRFINSLVTGCS